MSAVDSRFYNTTIPRSKKKKLCLISYFFPANSYFKNALNIVLFAKSFGYFVFHNIHTQNTNFKNYTTG